MKATLELDEAEVKLLMTVLAEQKYRLVRDMMEKLRAVLSKLNDQAKYGTTTISPDFSQNTIRERARQPDKA